MSMTRSRDSVRSEGKCDVDASQTGRPFISIVIPCLREQMHIRAVLDSVVAQDYPMDCLEILIVDGMSEDGTREIIKDYCLRYPFIQLLDNPKKNTPAALNIGIQSARGDIVVRMDAHTTYEHDYVSKCENALRETKADVVGGVIKVVPERDTLLGRAIAIADSHPFGVGTSFHRFGHATRVMQVDTVPFGSYRKELFERIGLFDEEIIRSEDADFHRRVKAAGGKILLVPGIVSKYQARSNIIASFKHTFQNGFLITYYLKYGKIAFFGRHLVPLGFVSTVLISAVLAPFNPIMLWLLVSVAGVYSLTNIAVSLRIAVQHKEPRYLATMPIAFAVLHLSHGTASLYGLLRATTSKDLWRRFLPNRRNSDDKS